MLKEKGIFYYLPVGVNVNKLERQAINQSEIQEAVSNISGKKIVFIDACHAGNVMRPKLIENISQTDINGVINELIEPENGAVVFTSSIASQVSFEHPEYQHGLFTYGLLKGLAGEITWSAENTINVSEVTYLDLASHLSKIVKLLAEKLNQVQTPTMTTPPNTPNYTLAIFK